MKVLLIDDEDDIRKVARLSLSRVGKMDVVDAAGGLDGLKRAEQESPDVILLDVMMPGMDGFEVCRVLKADPGISNTVVIFLSARGEVADKVSGLELGAIDYITKPIQGEEVLARVAAHLSKQHLERELRKSRDRLDKELAGAARMQQLLLPPVMPPHAALSFGTFYQTSRHAGGDYYDVLQLDKDRVGILVADVSGHGAPAAIVMAMIRAVVHTYPGVADDPPAVLNYINRHFEFLWDTPMYATATYAVLDAARGTLQLASAGHPLPLIASRDGTVTTASTETTMCLLWNELKEVPCSDYRLAAGDRWVFFTDGITDRQAPDGSMFDIERLAAAVAHDSNRAPADMVAAITAELDRFSGGQEPEDDQTLLVIGYK